MARWPVPGGRAMGTRTVLGLGQDRHDDDGNTYGHIGADLITLASILRIPVDMHNVASERIFRPSSWARFGALDPQGADYRACAAYGPLYR